MAKAKIDLNVQCNSTTVKGSLETDVDSCWHQEALVVKAAKECPDGKWVFSCEPTMFPQCGCKDIRFLAIKSDCYYDEEESKKCDAVEKTKQWCVWYIIHIAGKSPKKIPLWGPHYYAGEVLECIIGDKDITKIEICNGLCKDIKVELLAGLVCKMPECTRCYKQKDEEDPCESEKEYQTA